MKSSKQIIEGVQEELAKDTVTSDLEDVQRLARLKKQELIDKERANQESLQEERENYRHREQAVQDFYKRVLELKKQLKSEVKIVVKKSNDEVNILIGSYGVIREPYGRFRYSGEDESEEFLERIKDSVATVLVEGYSYELPEWLTRLIAFCCFIAGAILGIVIWMICEREWDTWGLVLGWMPGTIVWIVVFTVGSDFLTSKRFLYLFVFLILISLGTSIVFL